MPFAPSTLAYRTTTIAGIVIAMLVILAILYLGASAFFIILASLVLAAIFDGTARGLMRLGPSRQVAMAIVFLVTLIVLAAVFLLGGVTLVTQASQLASAVRDQAESLLEQLSQYGLPLGPGDMDAQEIGDLLPAPEGVVSTASTALFSIAGGLGNLFIIIFLAAFVAWQPRVYRRGLVSLFPKEKRPRIAQVIDSCAHALRMWLLGTSISMVTTLTVSWIALWLIGMPYAFLLALQAGLLTFIPTLGAFVAGVPIILTGLSVSPTMALLGVGVYVLIQGVESNVTTPIAQRWASSLPPALTLGAQLATGLLFGLAGFILAVPLVAILKTLVTMLYVEDVLGGPAPSDEGVS